MPRHIPAVQIGATFGDWTALGEQFRSDGKSWVPCVCRCGNQQPVALDALRLGRSKRCTACKMRAARTSRSRTDPSLPFQAQPDLRRRWSLVYKSMVLRCTDPENPAFPDYGQRGISVDPTWDHRDKFMQWVLTQPLHADATMSIDRIDNNGSYGPSNCRLATRSEQALNRRNTLWVDFQGERLPFLVFARQHLPNWTECYARICFTRKKLSPEQLIAAHANRRARRRKPLL